MRWCLELQNYQYTIEHRPNVCMQYVDALSRVHNILVLQKNSFEQTLALKQNTDQNIMKLKYELETKEHPLYELQNNLVYRKVDNGVVFYVLETMEFNILHTYNEMGHFGIGKTAELISCTYWFPNMRQKIKEYVSNCLKCIEFNPKSRPKEGFLHNIPKGKLPFECIHIDHYGPLEKTGKRNKYIFEIIDGFSKFVRFFACKNTKMEEVVEHLQTYFNCYSRPRVIISDRGSCFISQFFEDFTKENNIQHILIASGAPRASGQIERMNRLLTPLLGKFVDKKFINWGS